MNTVRVMSKRWIWEKEKFRLNRESLHNPQVTLLSGSIHSSGEAKSARLRKTHDDDSYKNLISEKPFVPQMQTVSNFFLEENVNWELGVEDLITECEFDVKEGRIGAEFGTEMKGPFCFAQITYHPPVPVTGCTSVPTELNLELSLDAGLLTAEEEDPHLVTNAFGSRETVDGDRIIDKIASITDDSSNSDLLRINADLLAGEQLPICQSPLYNSRIELDPVKTLVLDESDPEVFDSQERCYEIYGRPTSRDGEDDDDDDDDGENDDEDGNGSGQGGNGTDIHNNATFIALSKFFLLLTLFYHEFYC